MNADAMITGRYYYNGDVSVTVEQRVRRAAKMHLEKDGSYPDRAHVNPKVCNSPFILDFDGHQIQVEPDRKILEPITWIGIGNNHKGKEE